VTKDILKEKRILREDIKTNLSLTMAERSIPVMIFVEL
jgi:hypothetical protein